MRCVHLPSCDNEMFLWMIMSNIQWEEAVINKPNNRTRRRKVRPTGEKYCASFVNAVGARWDRSAAGACRENPSIIGCYKMEILLLFTNILILSHKIQKDSHAPPLTISQTFPCPKASLIDCSHGDVVLHKSSGRFPSVMLHLHSLVFMKPSVSQVGILHVLRSLLFTYGHQTGTRGSQKTDKKPECVTRWVIQRDEMQ